MITRQLVSHSFKSEKTEQTKTQTQTGYEAPKAVAIGTSQELLQGSWCSWNLDSWGNYYWRTYPG